MSEHYGLPLHVLTEEMQCGNFAKEQLLEDG
jgi:hypothetical protein